jgi:hypothetical protein
MFGHLQPLPFGQIPFDTEIGDEIIQIAEPAQGRFAWLGDCAIANQMLAVVTELNRLTTIAVAAMDRVVRRALDGRYLVARWAERRFSLALQTSRVMEKERIATLTNESLHRR